MAPFHLSNKQFQNLHSRDHDWYHYILKRPRGKVQGLQLTSLPNLAASRRNRFSIFTFFKSLVYPRVSQVVSCVRAHTAQKGRGRIIKHRLGFAKSTDISPSLSRVKVLSTTSQTTTSKARCIPWITTIPILSWWTRAHQRSRTEPPSSALPWRNISRSSARDTGVSCSCRGI